MFLSLVFFEKMENPGLLEEKKSCFFQENLLFNYGSLATYRI